MRYIQIVASGPASVLAVRPTIAALVTTELRALLRRYTIPHYWYLKPLLANYS